MVSLGRRTSTRQAERRNQNDDDDPIPREWFFDLEKEVKGHPVSVKIDGNRLITVYVFDNRFVQAYIEDLNTKYDE